MVVSEIGSPLSKIMAMLLINFHRLYSSQERSLLSKVCIKTSERFAEIWLLNSSDPLKQELNNFFANNVFAMLLNNVSLYSWLIICISKSMNMWFIICTLTVFRGNKSLSSVPFRNGILFLILKFCIYAKKSNVVLKLIYLLMLVYHLNS